MTMTMSPRILALAPAEIDGLAVAAAASRSGALGVDRTDGAGSKRSAVEDTYQQNHGVSMLGQAATLKDATTTIADLHRKIAAGDT